MKKAQKAGKAGGVIKRNCPQLANITTENPRKSKKAEKLRSNKYDLYKKDSC